MSDGSDDATAAAQRISAAIPGLRLRPEWVSSQRAALAGLSADTATDALLNLFAAADLRDASLGSLPPDLVRTHAVNVDGQHVLQVLQVVDISQASEQEGGDFGGAAGEEGEGGRVDGNQRRQRHPGTLKIVLTDGMQTVCGIERRPIAALRSTHAGMKLVLGNRPLLRRGLLLLEPQNLEVLGASRVSASSASNPAAERAREAGAGARGITGAMPAPATASAAREAFPASASAAPPPVVMSSHAAGASSEPAMPTAVHVASRERLAPAPAAASQIHVPASLPNSTPSQSSVGAEALSSGWMGSGSVRRYVAEARPVSDDGSLALKLHDGVLSSIWVLARANLLADLFRGALPTAWVGLAPMLHGFFELRRPAEASLGLEWEACSFHRGPSARDVTRMLEFLEQNRRRWSLRKSTCFLPLMFCGRVIIVANFLRRDVVVLERSAWLLR
eukprot:TRINITY_DN15780_c0_g1_i1.p1 TRINITY_DN15780_c0_g1~~TRINITY_DN15780_c0_g1_i1.p1  ORF type:complete len:448 (+),score=31.01 TRINITY_DN15780_c0_g1_i1:36-1379(+)